MKFIYISIIISLLQLSCKRDSEPDIDYCKLSIATLPSQTFHGTLYICNAQPPEMAFWPGDAHISLLNESLLTIHLTSDSVHFDTTLQYAIECIIVEETGTCIKLFDNNHVEAGGYNDDLKSIQFRFGYPGCLTNTFFEGMANN